MRYRFWGLLDSCLAAIVKKPVLWKLPPQENISIKVCIWIIIAVMSILSLAIGGMGLFGMSKDSESLRTVYEHHAQSLDQTSLIQKLMLVNQLRLNACLLNPDSDLIRKNLAEVEQNTATINKILDGYIASALSPAEKNLVNQVVNDRKRYLTEGLQPAISALRSNDLALASKLVNSKVNSLYEPVGEDIQKLLHVEKDDTGEELDASILRYYNTRTIAVVLTALGILLVMWLSFSLLSSISRRLDATMSHFSKIAQGNYNTLIEIKGRDEVSKVMAALKAMQIKLGFDVAEAKRIADENLHIKIALDNVSTGVILADNDRNIIYISINQ